MISIKGNIFLFLKILNILISYTNIIIKFNYFKILAFFIKKFSLKKYIFYYNMKEIGFSRIILHS